MSERLKRLVESHFSGSIGDSNEGISDVVAKDADKDAHEDVHVAWYKSLGLQLLHIPILMLTVWLPFVVLMTMWFFIVKAVWK